MTKNKKRILAAATLTASCLAVVGIFITLNHRSEVAEKVSIAATPAAIQSVEKIDLVAKKIFVESAPELPIGTKLVTLDSKKFLARLYGQHSKFADAKVKIDLSRDFKQTGKRRHIFISSFCVKGQRLPLVCVDIVEKNGKLWTVTEHRYYPQTESKFSLQQYGPDQFALLEKSETSGGHNKSELPSSEIKLSSIADGSFKLLLNVAQRAEKGETVKQNLYFLKKGNGPWSGRIKTVFNNGKPLVVKYIFGSGGYVPAGTIPSITMWQAEHIRGLPIADWD